MLRRVAVLLLLVAALAAPATAPAAPSDPPIVVLGPADGASVSVDPKGIPVSFTCPQYVIFDAGGPFIEYGFPDDYGISVSRGSALGPDGRLADPITLPVSGGARPRAADPATCDAVLASGELPPLQETPGAYFWQVWRPVGTSEYETAAPRRITLRANARVAVKPPRRAYADYPFLVPITLKGAPDGSELTLQRRRGKAWKTVLIVDAVLGRSDPVVRLPRGRHVLRVLAQIGADQVASPTATVRVLAARKWSTRANDVGSYRDAKRPSVRFRITAHGRTMRGFKADVPTICTIGGRIDPNISPVTFPPVPIAPDGRFVAELRRGAPAARLNGRLHRRKVTGVARFTNGSCSGSIAFTARRAGG